jgi:F0F1-type ATP synthase membrane subunit a
MYVKIYVLHQNLNFKHTLLKILLGFLLILIPVWNSTKIHSLWILPWLIIALVTCLEFAIGFLQAYVFTIGRYKK